MKIISDYVREIKKPVMQNGQDLNILYLHLNSALKQVQSTRGLYAVPLAVSLFIALLMQKVIYIKPVVGKHLQRVSGAISIMTKSHYSVINFTDKCNLFS